MATIAKPIANDHIEGLNVNQHELASFACNPFKSKGRLFNEDSSNNRGSFRRDCDRIIHSTAFRRLEYKTQVFVNHEGDHYRTRLTHSLEVAQIARSISRNLRLSEDLAEAMALAHDLGHTPFGHAGEEALNEATESDNFFDHNSHSLKILTKLEHKYAKFDGLNLTWESLEGIAKHNGPLLGDNANEHYKGRPLPAIIYDLNSKMDLQLDKFSSAEAQIAGFADDIAYNNHDIDDGLRAGLFTLDAVKELPMVGNMFRELHNEFPDLSHDRLIHEANRRMINRMIIDLTRNTINNIEENKIETVDDIRNLGKPLVNFSKNMQSNIKGIKEFLHKNMYRHYKVCRMSKKARRIIIELYNSFYHSPDCLPDGWRQAALAAKGKGRSEVIMDYIAGMTDRYATNEHRKLFDIEYR